MEKDHISRYQPRYNGKVDPSRCRASVWHTSGNWGSTSQCSNKAKGDTEWCGLHNPKAVQRRKDKQEQHYKDQRAASNARQRAIDERYKDVKRVTWLEKNSPPHSDCIPHQEIFSSEFLCSWKEGVSLRKHLDDLMEKETTDGQG